MDPHLRFDDEQAKNKITDTGVLTEYPSVIMDQHFITTLQNRFDARVLDARAELLRQFMMD